MNKASIKAQAAARSSGRLPAACLVLVLVKCISATLFPICRRSVDRSRPRVRLGSMSLNDWYPDKVNQAFFVRRFRGGRAFAGIRKRGCYKRRQIIKATLDHCNAPRPVASAFHNQPRRRKRLQSPPAIRLKVIATDFVAVFAAT
jgi:hypothetical protein